MPRNSSLTIRRLGNGASAPKGKNGKFLRVSVHKTTRKVEKMQPNNWTEEANTLFAHIYPEGLALKTRNRKKKVKMVTIVDIPVEEHQVKIEEEKEDCCICYSEIPNARTTLECGHSFCTKCILTWFQRNNSCPMCRTTIPEAASQRGLRRHLNIGLARAIIESTNRNIENSYAVVPTRTILASRTRRWGNAGSNYAMAVLAHLSDTMESVDDGLYDRLVPVYNQNN
jgi:hypothetical protein